jgi:hypothetical protein
VSKFLKYRTATTVPLSPPSGQENDPNVPRSEVIVGPHRVLPGRLSVCRTFGDLEAKIEQFGGNPNVVISAPEIKSFKIAYDHDFIALGSKIYN